MSTRRVLGGLLIGAGLACARPAPPPGGPIDMTPPEVLSVSPEPGARGVPTDTPLTIEFSESVDKKSLERALWVSPGGAVKPKFSTSGETVTIRLGVAFPETTTVGVLLTTEIRDRKRDSQQNALRRPYRWVFSTGDRIEPGSIRGMVEMDGPMKTRRRGQVLVVVHPAGSDTLPDLTLFPPLAIAEADSAGHFEVAGLPVTGERLKVRALFDRDGNRAIRGQGEFVSAESETLALSAGQPVRDVALRLVSPDAPGALTGNLVRGEGDTTAVGLAVFTRAEGDSVGRAVKSGTVRPDGSFSIPGVPPGQYTVQAFCDVNANGRQDEDEPSIVYGPVTVRPGTDFELGSWEIPACPAGAGTQTTGR